MTSPSDSNRGGSEPNRPAASVQAAPVAGEFVVRVTHRYSGRAMPVFTVHAKNEAAARKLCQRNYLTVAEVLPYVVSEWNEKPKTLKYGPPISDKDFELDYGNRPPEKLQKPGTDIEELKQVLEILGGLG